MKLPDGEHLIENKIYVVKDGEIIEIKEKEKEELAEEPAQEQEAEETVDEAAEDVQEEEADAAAEDVEMAVDVATDAEAVLAIVAPVIEEQVNQILAIIADLKNQVEEYLAPREEEEEVEIEAKKNYMSSRELFKEFVKFSKNK